MVENCDNEYYVFDSPRICQLQSTRNTELLNAYLRHYGIVLRESLNNYQWNDMNARFLISIPGVRTHTDCWRALFTKCPKGKAVIQCPSGSLNYDIHETLGVQQITFRVPNNWQTDQRCSFFLIDAYPTFNNKWLTLEHFDLQPEDVGYHFKRYTIYTLHPQQMWRIITSANMSRAAWGSRQCTAKNAEFGIAWPFRNVIYNIF